MYVGIPEHKVYSLVKGVRRGDVKPSRVIGLNTVYSPDDMDGICKHDERKQRALEKMRERLESVRSGEIKPADGYVLFGYSSKGLIGYKDVKRAFAAGIEKNFKKGLSFELYDLGDDDLYPLINSDDATVKRIGVSHKRFGERLRHFIEGYDREEFDEDFAVGRTEFNGRFEGCCWKDLYDLEFPEVYYHILNTKTGEQLTVTPLMVHAIEKHGYYGGKKSLLRLEPEIAARILF